MDFVMVFLALLAGLAVGAQSAINGALGHKTGTVEATFVSLSTGTLLFAVITVFFGRGDLGAVMDAPKWQLSAVFLAILFVSLMVYCVRRIGVIATSILTISGQMLSGLVIDHFGWFGSARIPLDIKRLIAIVFIALALYFIYRSNRRTTQTRR